MGFPHSKEIYPMLEMHPEDIPDYSGYLSQNNKGETNRVEAIEIPSINFYNKSVEKLWIVLTKEGTSTIVMSIELEPGQLINYVLIDNELSAGKIIVYYRNPARWNKIWPYQSGLRYKNIPLEYSQVIYASLKRGRNSSYWIYNMHSSSNITIPLYLHAPSNQPEMNPLFHVNPQKSPWTLRRRNDGTEDVKKNFSKTASRLDVVFI